LDYPGGDVDNYVKGIFDAINDNKTIWNDDKQIIGTWIDKQWAQDEESEGTTVVIYPIL
jgi:Holliday junction resolvase RusA-like endonuclease